MNEMNQIPAAEAAAPDGVLNGTLPQTAAYPQTQKRVFDLLPHDPAFAWILLPFGFLFTRYVLFRADGFFTTGFYLLQRDLSEKIRLQNLSFAPDSRRNPLCVQHGVFDHCKPAAARTLLCLCDGAVYLADTCRRSRNRLRHAVPAV